MPVFMLWDVGILFGSSLKMCLRCTCLSKFHFVTRVSQVLLHVFRKIKERERETSGKIVKSKNHNLWSACCVLGPSHVLSLILKNPSQQVSRKHHFLDEWYEAAIVSVVSPCPCLEVAKNYFSFLLCQVIHLPTLGILELHTFSFLSFERVWIFDTSIL